LVIPLHGEVGSGIGIIEWRRGRLELELGLVIWK